MQKMVGKFREVDAYGNVYKGDVLNGRRHGQGILLYAETGDVYQGDFENGLPHGSGKYIRGGKVDGSKDGIFEGLWDNGQLAAVKKGKAKIIMENGDVYEGGFNHWKRHGQGKLIEYNGAIYKGQWKDGLRHGFGKQFYPDGYMFQGQFKDDKPVKDGTHKEAFSVIMNSDSIELNPLDTKNNDAKIPYEKYKKGIQKPRHRSRSRNDRMTPIFPGREQRDDSYQMRQTGAQHTQNVNIPPRSPSRKSSHRIETQQKKIEDDIPRTISFLSVSDQQDDEDEDPLKFDDDTGFVGVEYQVSSIARANEKSWDAFPRNGSNFSRHNFKDTTRGKNSTHPSHQQGSAVDNASSNTRKGFGFLRPLSRKRSKATEKPTNTNNHTDVFLTGYKGPQAHSIPFVQMHDDGGEEASGLTPPHFRHTRSDVHSRGRSMSSNIKVRSTSPLPRSSSQFSNHYQIGASSNGYAAEPHMPISLSRSESRKNQQPPRSPARSNKPPTPSRSSSVSRNVQRGRSLPRSRSRPTSNKKVHQRLSVSRGGSKEPQWTRKTTSNTLSVERKRSSPVPRVHHVQGIRKENRNQVNDVQIGVTDHENFDKRRADSRGRSGNQGVFEPIRVMNQGNFEARQIDSRGRSKSRSRTPASELIHQEGMAGYNLSHAQSVQSRKSQYSDVHMVRSISNKGNSGTLGILTLNASSSEDSDYFVK